MNNCPCCSAQLLRHVRNNSIYWLCPRCRQEMPVLCNRNVMANTTHNVQIEPILSPIFARSVSMRP